MTKPASRDRYRKPVARHSSEFSNTTDSYFTFSGRKSSSRFCKVVVPGSRQIAASAGSAALFTPSFALANVSEPQGHASEQWTRFSAKYDARLEGMSIGSIPKAESTFLVRCSKA
jgi:hypothetical protein